MPMCGDGKKYDIKHFLILHMPIKTVDETKLNTKTLTCSVSFRRGNSLTLNVLGFLVYRIIAKKAHDCDILRFKLHMTTKWLYQNLCFDYTWHTL